MAIQRKFLFSALGALGVMVSAVSVPVIADDSALTGRDIMDESGERHDREYEFEQQTMTLIDRRGNEEVRAVRRYNRSPEGEDARILLVFDSPNGVKGTAMLTHGKKGGEDDQWMLLPAQGKKLKRTAKGNKKSYFMGTDFTFEDMSSEDKDDFDYRRQADGDVDGAPHFVVDAYPVNEDVAQASGYKYRRLYLSKDLYFNAKTEFYDKRGKLLKIQTASDLISIGGQAYRPKVILMDNVKKKHKTRVNVEDRIFEEKKVAKKKFEHRYLTSGRYMRDN